MKKIFAALLIAVFMCASQGFAQTTVEGDITSDTTWSSDVLLSGAVFVKNGATLTVQKGVTVYGEKATIGTLIIAQGAKLNINGTKDEPVIFTSDQASPARADWGGLIINGYSTLNKPGGLGEGEGDTGQYGCSGSDCNEADNSGTMQYFRVEFAGIEFSPDNELNGIALQGVGSGTTLDHFQVHANKDDGIEMFGGTVNWKYGILTECADDSIDWTEGWRGSVQFAVVQQKADDADQGLECDSLGKDPSAAPRANPALYNLTVIGDPSTTYGDESDIGVLLRAGTAVNLRNSIVMGFKEAGLDIDDEETFEVANGNRDEEMIVDNNIFYNNNPNFSDEAEEEFVAPFTPKTFMTSMMSNNLEADPKLGDAYDLTAPDFRPGSGSPAIDGTVTVASAPTGNSFITSTDYIGAVDPDDDWTRQPWTRWGLADWTKEPECTDNDGDGYGVGEGCTGTDCDDTDASVNPGASEVCDDGKDNDCDGDVDTADSDCEDDTPDPTDCPVEMVLGADNANLDILRNFRDTVMAESATGALYTQLYYHYTEEVKAILGADAALNAKTKIALDKVVDLAGSAVDGKTVVLSDSLAQELLSILSAISEKAGLGLKITIFKAKADIASGNLPF